MQELISTKKSFCRDCYKCLRVCDVKAIGVKNGQAKVDEVRCILCGYCVKECPREAKVVKNQVAFVKELLQDSTTVVASIAPSYAALWTQEDWKRMKSQLYQLGFAAVEETAIGVEDTVNGYIDLLNKGEKNIITSCCPVIVNQIEKYFPSLLKNLAPVNSPMVNHGKILKQKYGENTKVVFIGPCIAKMQEDNTGTISSVLGFTQLKQLLSPNCKFENYDSDNDHFLDELPSLYRAYPLHQGVVKVIKQNKEDIIYYSAQGVKDCKEVLTAIVNKELDVDIVELMACHGGCIGGPLMSESTMVKRTQKFINNIKLSINRSRKDRTDIIKDKRIFMPKPITNIKITEQDIREVLKKMGKNTYSDEKNCSGCGYESCREKAKAVICGMAEPEMCVSFMKEKAESMANTIVDSTPNAIIVVNSRMEVQEFNPSAKSIFSEIPWRPGLDLSKHLDVQYYVEVKNSKRPLKNLKIVYGEWGLVTRQIISPILESDSVMAIITDITDIERRQIEMEKMKDEIIDKAHEVINRQMFVAQQIAGLLGETTAETKATLLELVSHIKNTEGEKQ